MNLLTPDPQLISCKLFIREQSPDNSCNEGLGDKDYSVESNCDYLKAPFFNVLAAFWIQFMTHDWFSHTVEGHNRKDLQPVGCASEEAQSLAADDPRRAHQKETVKRMREVYGTHICDASKIISVVQRDAAGNFITDCHDQPDGSTIDNIEDVDLVVGWLAEYTRPHGFAISDTQFHVFIINASRRLFSDRFFTSSFRPEFYSQAGYDWVQNNGPIDGCPFALDKDVDGDPVCLEPVQVNGHDQEVSPMKRLLLRTIPSLSDELLPVRNVFDPWARDRGEYYSLEWTPRLGAENDSAFSKQMGAME